MTLSPLVDITKGSIVVKRGPLRMGLGRPSKGPVGEEEVATPMANPAEPNWRAEI
jgi:hypothetical protein